MKGLSYINKVNALIDKAWNSQTDIIGEIVNIISAAIINKNNIYVFGCSHASILAQEVFYRTGGLAVINPIFFEGLNLDVKPVNLTSSLERLHGYAELMLGKINFKEDDILIIHSVSGRNVVPTEMAEYAKKRGVKTIALTNLEYSSQVTSRHNSGKRLFEVCDIVLDNCGEFGDACISIEGFSEKIAPTSTVVGAALLNAIIVEVVEKLLELGVVPPIFISANVDGGDLHNKKILEEYKDNIFYM